MLLKFFFIFYVLLVNFLFRRFRPFVRDCESHIYIKQGRHPVIDNLLPENEQFVPNDTDMNVSHYCLTGSYLFCQLSVKQSLFISKTPRYPEPTIPVIPVPGCESFSSSCIHLPRQVGDLLSERRVISRVWVQLWLLDITVKRYIATDIT